MYALGAEPIEIDLLDAAVRKAVLDGKPEAIVHQATALADLRDFKHFDRSFAQTNRLRTEGTDMLLAAAREAGVRIPLFRAILPCLASRFTRTRGSLWASAWKRWLDCTPHGKRPCYQTNGTRRCRTFFSYSA